MTRVPAMNICVVDFCGYTKPGHFPCSFWADYWPADGAVTFGGDWADVPDMPITREPSEDEVTRWARYHGAEFA